MKKFSVSLGALLLAVIVVSLLLPVNHRVAPLNSTGPTLVADGLPGMPYPPPPPPQNPPPQKFRGTTPADVVVADGLPGMPYPPPPPQNPPPQKFHGTSALKDALAV